jgi:glycosyltransferase involved in cell wall biosynthesis
MGGRRDTPSPSGFPLSRVLVVDPLGGFTSGGYGKYLTTLLPVLKANLPSDGHLGLATRSIAALPIPGVHLHRYRGRKQLRALADALQVHVVLVPTARSLPDLGVPVVCMVRNMEPFDHPASFVQPSLALKNLLRRRQALRACASANRVLAVSGHVREVLRERGVPAHKLDVVRHGIDRPDETVSVRPAAAPRSPFVFSAGSVRPARGLEDLLRAVPHWPAGLDLLFAGSVHPDARRYERRMRALVRRLGIEDRVHWAGQLPPEEMAWCFSQTVVFVTTSRAEACPNTLLEAMSHGCACVATDTPPMPEFLGAAGLLYEVGDARALAHAVGSIVCDADRAALLGNQARAGVATLTWERTAQRTVEALTAAASTRGTR